AAYRREPSFGVIERDDGLVTPHDPRIYLAPPQQWNRLERAACDRVMGRVLDVGCGAGRHGLFLQARGHAVTGIEPSPGAAAVARGRGLQDVHEIGVEDLGSWDRKYDTILMLGTCLGLLGSARKASTVLAALAHVASPGARVLGGNLDPYATKDAEHLEYLARNRARGRMPGQTRLRARFRRLVGGWTEMLWCSVEELRTLVASSPWRVGHVEESDGGYVAELRLE
ncbi:MAG TPA: class I SAM-dependent methyltransferase, partial [Actinopolymorphaceae bacterium]